MNDAPFWLPGVTAVVLTCVVGAFLLPIIVWLYRLENWVITWPLPEWERTEQRDGFEVQLTAFLVEERRQGYQPPWSGLRLLVRMLSTLPVDMWDSGHALASRVSPALRFMVQPLLDRMLLSRLAHGFSFMLPDWVRRVFRRTQRPRQPDVPVTHSRSAKVAVALSGNTAASSGLPDDERLRITQQNHAMMESANQVVRHNAALRERAYRIAMDSTGAQNPSIALLHSVQRHTPHPVPDGPKLEPITAWVLPDTTG